LIIGMTASALIILVEYGGLAGLMPADCQNLALEDSGELTGCVAVTRPDLVQGTSWHNL
jgi:hypothetical protein